MNPLFRKDVREHFRLALLGFAIFALGILLDIHVGRVLVHRFAFSQVSSETNTLQPLLSTGFLTGASIFCAIFRRGLGMVPDPQ